MADDLQARLEGHSKAFEGLMSLIPAKYYYGEDNSDQWQRKKQTKEEKRQAKKAKLDPANRQSALDVHKENERKRKRELGQDDEGGSQMSDIDDQSKEKPLEGLKSSKKVSKKLKTEVEPADGGVDSELRQKQIADKRREARERKKAKKAKLQEKKEAKKARKAQDSSSALSQNSAPARPDASLDADEGVEAENENAADDMGEAQLSALDFSGLSADDDAQSISSKDSSSASPIFDRDNSTSNSSASSSSSIIPSTDTSSASQRRDVKPTSSKSVHSSESGVGQLAATETNSSDISGEATKVNKLPSIDSSVLQARLAARLEALRAARKADGLNGKPAKNRQELIEARRRKEEQRRAHKKELRAKARVQKDAEAEAARLRGGSGSPLWSPAIQSPKQENSFEFGRVAFDDGAELDSSLMGVVEARSKKGPSDTKTALQAAQKKQARVSGLDAEKRAEIEEKDRWLNAKKRVHGEKLRNDATLLKKTLKREEKQKSKSEKAWNERIEGVRHGQEMRQKRREENLQKRRDGKGATRKGAKKPVGKPKPKKRPGFEGSFKAGGARS